MGAFREGFPGSNPTEMNLLLLKLPKNVLKDDQIQRKPQNPHLLRFSMATSLVLGTLKTPNIPGLRYTENSNFILNLFISHKLINKMFSRREQSRILSGFVLTSS